MKFKRFDFVGYKGMNVEWEGGSVSYLGIVESCTKDTVNICVIYSRYGGEGSYQPAWFVGDSICLKIEKVHHAETWAFPWDFPGYRGYGLNDFGRLDELRRRIRTFGK